MMTWLLRVINNNFMQLQIISIARAFTNRARGACTMRGSHMPMYHGGHDRSRRKKGPSVAEIVAGVLGVVTLILLLGA